MNKISVVCGLILLLFFSFGCIDSKKSSGSYDKCADKECTQWYFTPSPCLAGQEINWTYDDCGCAVDYDCIPAS